ncbi:M48 family metallopeptidase [Salinivirga cyanobacteriivorans]
MTILYIVIVILILEYAVNELVDYLNLKHELKPVSPYLSRIFSYMQRKKMHLYHLANYRTGFFSSLVSLIVILSLLIFNGFGQIDYWIRSYFDNEILITLAFFGVIGVGGSILALPWEVYNTFYIEKRFDFNRQTPVLFILDKIKGMAVSILLGGGILAIVTWIYYNLNDHFWWIAWAVITSFSLFMTMFYSNLIVPLFNKQRPLEEGELRAEIEETAEKAGFKLDNIYVIDGSKRSTKSNAYFTGIGPKKRIVLYDTLINDLSNEEIVAVLAHEIGHYKKKHVTRNFITGVLQTGVILLLFDFITGYDAIYKAIGAVKPSFHMGLLVFGFLFTPASILIGLVTSYFSRKAEYQADAFAAKLGKARALIGALLKLTDKNLSNINPHPAFVFMHYSHPPVNERIKYLESLKDQS